jgi:HlyD family secretion protein
VSSAPSQMGAYGRVLRFPSTTPTASKHISRLRRYGLVALAVLLVIFTGLGAALWSFIGKSTAQYVTESISRGTVTRAVTATGTVNPELTVIVGTYVSGVT